MINWKGNNPVTLHAGQAAEILGWKKVPPVGLMVTQVIKLINNTNSSNGNPSLISNRKTLRNFPNPIARVTKKK